MAAGPGREQGMTLAPRSAGQLSPSCAGVEATVPARLAFPCPAHLQSAHPAPGRFSFPVCCSLARPSPLPVPGAAVTLTTLCVVQQVPPPASALAPLCPGCPSPASSGAWSFWGRWKGLPRPQRCCCFTAPPTPARSAHLLLLPSPSPAWSECIFSWADRRPVGVQVPVGVLRTSWVTLGVSELRARPSWVGAVTQSLQWPL